MSRFPGATRNRRAALTTAVGSRLIPIVPFLEDELRLVPSLVPPGGTCIDVGSAHGIYTVAMADAVGPAGRVLAFEPQPLPHRVSRGVHRALGLGRVVEQHRVALGDREGRTSLIVPYRRRLPISGRAFLASAPGLGDDALDEFTASQRVEVEVRPLDAVVADLRIDRLDLVKIDVEGAELRTLHGAQATLAEHRPALIVEIEDRHTRKYGHRAADVLGWLRGRGYRAAVATGDRLRRTDEIVEGTRNYVFVAEGGAPVRR